MGCTYAHIQAHQTTQAVAAGRHETTPPYTACIQAAGKQQTTILRAAGRDKASGIRFTGRRQHKAAWVHKVIYKERDAYTHLSPYIL